MKQHEHLETDVLADFQPIFYREPDKTKGEIFPTVWYGSNIEVTSIQQAIIAKAILTAENPYLKYVAPLLLDHFFFLSLLPFLPW